MIQMKRVTFKSDGLTLAGILHLPSKPTKRAIITAHGITVDKDEDGIFIHTAERLKTLGTAVFRFDFRGHGESEGDSINLTISGEVSDLDHAIKFIKQLGYREIGLLAASFGGGVAVLYLAQNPSIAKTLVLWDPVLNYQTTFLKPYLPWLKDIRNQIFKDLETKGWAELGSSRFKLGKGIFDEMKKTKPYEKLNRIVCPTLIIHGDQDDKVPYEGSVKYVKLIKGPAELKTIKGSKHGFHTPKAEKEAIRATFDFFKGNF